MAGNIIIDIQRAPEPFGNETQYFFDCILHDRHPEADGEEGLLDVRVLAAVEQSLATGASVSLPPYSAAAGCKLIKPWS